MAATRATSSRRAISSGEGFGPAPIAVSAHTAAKLPHMKTSEWAKLIRRSTPYTNV